MNIIIIITPILNHKENPAHRVLGVCSERLGHPRGQNPTHGTLPVTPGQPALAGSPPVSPPLASYASIWTFLVFSASPHPSLQEKESFGENQPRGSLCSWLVSESRSLVSNSLQPHGLYDFPGQNTGVGSLSLLQGIFPTQGSNPGLPHRRRILYQLSHK